MPSGYSQPALLLEPRDLVSRGTLHRRSRWLARLRRCHGEVSIMTAFLYMQAVLTTFCRNEKYLYMGGPLLAGVTVVALSSLAPMALPLGMRGLAITEAISLYGGLAVFSGFVLFE